MVLGRIAVGLLGVALLIFVAGAASAESSKSGGKQDLKGTSTGSGTHQGEGASMSTQQGGNTGSKTGRNADSGSATGAVRDPSTAEPGADQASDKTAVIAGIATFACAERGTSESDEGAD